MGTKREEKQKGSLDELRGLLKDFDTVMLSSITSTGEIHSRPMAVQEPGDLPDCDLWFVTEKDSIKVDEIAGNDKVGVAGVRKDRSYLTISARARIVKDQAEVRRLWKPDWKLFWPDGPEGHDIVIVKLQVLRAEYWEPGGKLRVLIGLVKAMVGGKALDEELPPAKTV